MNLFSPRLLSSAVACLLAATPGFSRTLIHAGTLVDSVSDAPRHQATVIIEGERIAAVEDGFTAPKEGDQVIDLSKETVTPGWIDCHVHLDIVISPQYYTDAVMLNPGDFALRAAYNAKLTLMAGFTTVRNLGDRANSTIALKKSIAKGEAIGPRIYTAGKPIGTTGGHADPTDGFNEKVMSMPSPSDGVINGPEQARQAVRQHYKEGADLIKIMASGGVLSVEVSGDNAQMDEDEIKAVVTTAHEYGMKVAAAPDESPVVPLSATQNLFHCPIQFTRRLLLVTEQANEQSRARTVRLASGQGIKPHNQFHHAPIQ